MAAGDSIEGLMEWAQREPWVDDFDALFERIAGPPPARPASRSRISRTRSARI
jgi:hypothetical protein